jgi:hypothetical protein
MKKHFILTIMFILTLSCAIGQTLTPSDTSKIKMRGDYSYFIDGYKVYSNLTKSDSIKILKDVVSKLNGKWTSTQNNSVFVDEYKLSDITFKGKVSNPDIILAAPYVRLEFIGGQVKIISARTVGQFFVDDDTLNIRVTENELNINGLIHHKQKAK